MENLSERFKKIRDFAEPYLRTRSNDLHTTLATKCALELLEKEEGDADIVIPAIILHDIGWIRVPEKEQVKAYGPGADAPEITRIHEKEGVKIAREILETVFYDKDKLIEIIRIIDGHDSRKEAISINDQIAKDADKLSRYDPDVSQAFSKNLDIKRNENDLRDLEKKIEKWFFTEGAKEIAREKIKKIFVEKSSSNRDINENPQNDP